MPYILPERRRDNTPGDVEFSGPLNAGELNFAITTMCLDYVDNIVEHSYQSYNEVIGVLESAKLEFYRRQVARYEDHKIKANGDVYDT